MAMFLAPPFWVAVGEAAAAVGAFISANAVPIAAGAVVVGGSAVVVNQMSKAEEEAAAKEEAGADSEVCQNCDEDGNPCLVGPYAEIAKQCASRGGNAHHIVPDRVYRLGTRPTGALERTTFNRIRGAPSLANGMSVCLSPAQHVAAHAATDPAITALGAATGGVAPMAAILAASQNGINTVPGLNQSCKEQANRAASNQVRSGTGLVAPGRTSMNPPRVLSEAARLLTRGYY